ncbi:uncharacterized protein LOC6617299 isoform X1 [Drosophila sechellia]|uniref:GM16645 n=1 Tax=Drosophila sechellia TaxID=7238 RepID=B4ID16_DROSE|nr:uncharacterized protein LOC6617299 isoform X1 [Drosophila sechellia]XP_032570627.1 uncharacterized protein LOC6617299 isoform X1 [Drosophila sechellia]EDW45442.1 GM16645 [Drosophila sechellia]
MKTSGAGNPDELNKSSHSKVSKKSTKSRSKSAKLELTGKNSLSASASSSTASAVSGGIAVGSLPATPTHLNMVTTPTTPTSSLGNYNLFDASFVVAGSGGHGLAGGIGGAETSGNSSRMGHQKSYAGFDPRSIKIFWEQHDQTDVELSQDVCARLAEDASYKVWELINNVKIYSRHSGGVVTYDLVNEVLKDADVPPMLGAMDSDWDRIDYDGSFYFHSDKIFELSAEFQKEVNLCTPDDADFQSICPVDEKHIEQLTQCVQSLVTAALFGDSKSQTAAVCHAFQTPLMGSIYRVIVSKMVQLLAFKQQDHLSQRCWRLLRACNYNATANHNACRPEYFNLAEVLVSQLMAPYETIKAPHVDPDPGQTTSIKMEFEEELKVEPDQCPNPETQENPEVMGVEKQEQAPHMFPGESTMEHTIYKLQSEEEEMNPQPETEHLSSFFACPVGNGLVDELCETIGQLASQSGYLHAECLFLIKRRLERFFEGRHISSERDFRYISRAVRGLISLGEYAFREFIPYIYKLRVEEIPDSLWPDLAPAAIFLGGRDDVYLYEWLEYGCGAALQPFLVHYARAYEKMVTRRYVKAKQPAYRIESVPGVRRLEWSTLAAAMCHGDDPSKALKPKPTLCEAFPDLQSPNLQLNCAGNIRFKFAGCRPVLLKPKVATVPHSADSPSLAANGGGGGGASSDILIAKRKLFKPLTNVRKWSPISGYHYLRI